MKNQGGQRAGGRLTNRFGKAPASVRPSIAEAKTEMTSILTALKALRDEAASARLSPAQEEQFVDLLARTQVITWLLGDEWPSGPVH